MAGHSHWAGIRRKKEAEDAKRGRVFSRMAKLITTAARQGGGDPSNNLKLSFAIEQAKSANMPKDSIERAIKKGTGELSDGAKLEETSYEGYGPGGVAILIEAVTDNRNRTTSDMRHLMESSGGTLGQVGCVGWMFEKKGLFIVDTDKMKEDTLTEVALKVGAEDLEQVGGTYQITCAPQDFAAVRDGLEERGVPLDSAELANIPKANQPVDAETGRKIIQLLENLEDHEDVQSVTANVDLPAELLAEAG